MLFYRHNIYLPLATSRVTQNLREADNTAVYGVMSDYFGGGDLEEEDLILDVLTLFNELAIVIEVQLQNIHVTLAILFIYRYIYVPRFLGKCAFYRKRCAF